LNCTIQKAVADAQAAGIKIKYVDVTGVFAGHGIGSDDPYINERESAPIIRMLRVPCLC
jgi:hypothetical protein